MPKKIVIIGAGPIGNTTVAAQLVALQNQGHEIVSVPTVEDAKKEMGEDPERGIVILKDDIDPFNRELPPPPPELYDSKMIKEFTKYPLEEPKTGRQKRTERRKKNRKKKR